MVKLTYQQLQDQLDVAVARLESGELAIDDAVNAYEAALKLIKQLEEYLKTAETKVEELGKQYGQ